MKKMAESRSKSRSEIIEGLMKKVNNQLDALITIDMHFLDFKAFDFEIKVGVWNALPDEVAKDVRTMGIVNTIEKVLILTTYGAGSYIAPHFHSDAYECIKVLYGYFEDKTTGKQLYKDDEVVFPPNQKHYITSDTGGVLLICFAKDYKNLNFIY